MKVEGYAEEGDGGTHDGVENPEEIGSGVLVDGHVAADLGPVKAVIPDFERRDDLEADDVENVDIQRVVATIDHEALDRTVVAVEP